MGRVVFVTGTDTGVGKTILTGLLLIHARSLGLETAALKPFCSGGRGDAELLWELQDRRMPLDQVNPFHFPEPLSPWTAARLDGRAVRLDDTLGAIRAVPAPLLLIEGAGGLLAPLGELFSALDLIDALRAEVIIVAPNRLGVLNHTLLTLAALQSRSVQRVRVVLVEPEAPDESSAHNLEDLRSLAAPVPVLPFPRLPHCRTEPGRLRTLAPSVAGSLGPILAPAVP